MGTCNEFGFNLVNTFRPPNHFFICLDHHVERLISLFMEIFACPKLCDNMNCFIFLSPSIFSSCASNFNNGSSSLFFALSLSLCSYFPRCLFSGKYFLALRLSHDLQAPVNKLTHVFYISRGLYPNAPLLRSRLADPALTISKMLVLRNGQLMPQCGARILTATVVVFFASVGFI